MSWLRVKNWQSFQHYKDRSPPWIKLHRELLRDYDFCCLQDASKLHLMLIWLLASQLDNKVPNDPDWIQRQIGVSDPVDLKPLIEHGFLIVASEQLAECKQSAMRETETETETETEKEYAQQQPETPNASRKRSAKTRGTRLPENWRPDADLQAWALKENPHIDIQRVLDSFTDYWRGKAGAAARKVDWPATFRNWVRNDNGKNQVGSNGTPETAVQRATRKERDALARLGYPPANGHDRTVETSA